MIYINGTGYADDDPVTWEDAISEGGFYFSRACYLGLPNPPAILFDEPDPRFLPAMVRYHELFTAAETKGMEAEETEEREMSLEAADQNLLLVMNRLRELADSVPPGQPVRVEVGELDILAEMLSAARACL